MPRRTDGRPAPGYHEGEVAVQQQAGVRAEARHLVRMLEPVELVGGIVGFLAQRTFLVMTARDAIGNLWVTPVTGPEGFLEVTGRSDLHIAAGPQPGDPLFGLPAGQDIGLITIDFAKRRRCRLNGHLAGAGRTDLNVEVEQAYGNCPQHIQQRILAAPAAAGEDGDEATPDPGTRTVTDRLSEEDITQIRSADTFFLGTTHPSRGNDASHRGGPAGFVRVDDHQTLWWPDFPGNNMFNSLGNLAVDPAAALLFVDFTTGRTLHLAGQAVLETTASGVAGDDGHTGRRVRFHLDAKTGARFPLRAREPWATPPQPAYGSTSTQHAPLGLME
ncbi:pyridoxamine 5'-phosphate oxidase [Jiangella aurantiaca]|uniref:Pyridoxamine 5'-phosphate oxidase n=1 Tax=Jiangella aurantiaca TaxID=2530373 RepID=A0A4R5AGX0_9ACTN|nr:pyridoxamine 5'-phosphate oxidase family protein [Jiangella aurantiaca]TDD70646.1 pyridoxamine 5'-phosphate oxidase [Jiangella aurantiaca]